MQTTGRFERKGRSGDRRLLGHRRSHRAGARGGRRGRCIAARRMKRLDDLAERIRQAGGEALPIEADVTDEAQASAMVERGLQHFGRLDMLLTVAGVGVAAPFQNTTTAEYRRWSTSTSWGCSIRINAALPAMKRQGTGHIVIVSSGTGRYIHPSVVYAGTKHAASAMAESLRREIGRDGIRVTGDRAGRHQDRIRLADARRNPRRGRAKAGRHGAAGE